MNAVLKLIKSFVYAFKGIFVCVKSCRNFRIHIIAVLFVLYFSKFYAFDKTEYAVLLLTFSSVLAMEAVNCALEYTCNAVTEKYSRHIKQAKDAAAAAVLISALFAVAVAVVLFGDLQVLSQIFSWFYASAARIAVFAVTVIISILFVFYEDILNGRKK